MQAIWDLKLQNYQVWTVKFLPQYPCLSCLLLLLLIYVAGNADAQPGTTGQYNPKDTMAHDRTLEWMFHLRAQWYMILQTCPTTRDFFTGNAHMNSHTHSDAQWQLPLLALH